MSDQWWKTRGPRNPYEEQLLKKNPWMLESANDPPPPSDQVFENEAQNDPRLERQANRVEDRLDNFGKYTDQSIDMAVSDIRDQTEGRRAAMQGMLARRGIGGTGFEGQMERGLASDEARASAAATSGMRIERDKDYDALLLGSTGAVGAPGAANRADRSLALEAYNTAQSNRRANETLEMQKLQQQIDLLLDTTRLGGMSGMMQAPQPKMGTFSGGGWNMGGGGWGAR